MDFDLSYGGAALACDPEVTYKVNDELSRAWELVENTGVNLFLTGRAGTGKTTFLKKLRESSRKRMVVLAPTGIAAINASGTTLHSFFQLPFSPYIPGQGFAGNDRKHLNVSKAKRRLILSLSLLVIDEVSMVRPDVLDAIDSILRRLRGSQAPFGGVQLLLIGDLRQLPPVVREEEWGLVKEHYASPYFFESHALKKAGFYSIELTTVYRQNDLEFLDLLNGIRDGKASTDTLQRLNRRFLPSFNPSESEGYIRLTTHNRSANDLNNSRLAALPAPEYEFEAEVEGDFPDSAFPTDRILRLKEGAQVMFVKNDVGNTVRRYYNGLIGTVTSLSDDKICVRPAGGGDVIEVDRAEWENTRYKLDEKTHTVAQETVGTFRQYPLQLAWAITIHKSQGLTFDKAIIDAAHSFAPGQTYVALSRCRSLEGLVLGSPLPARAVITDQGVNDFINYCASQAPDASAIENLKTRYTYTLLKELFDFSSIRNAYFDFYRVALDYLVPVHPDIERGLHDTRQKIEKDLAEVASKFLAAYSEAEVGAALATSDSPLQKRIRKGCEYFGDIVEDIVRFLKRLPREIDNQAYAQRLGNTFGPLLDLLAVKDALLTAHTIKPFTAENFLNVKSKALVDLEGTGASDAARRPAAATRKKTPGANPRKPKPGGEQRAKGYSAFETLRLYREGKDINQIAAERKLSPVTVAKHISQLIETDRIKQDELSPQDRLAVDNVDKRIGSIMRNKKNS